MHDFIAFELLRQARERDHRRRDELARQRAEIKLLSARHGRRES